MAKSKPTATTKSTPGKKPSKPAGEIRDEDLRSVSGGLASVDGSTPVRGGCLTQP